MTESPAWARGQSLAALGAYADIFRKAHGKHVHGAFGLVKERDIAAAIDEFRLVCADGHPGESACAISTVLHRGSRHHDFTGATWELPIGSLYVSAFAAPSFHAANELLATLRHWHSGWPLFVEIFEEDVFAKAAVASGLSYWFTKVSAGGDIKGVYSSVKNWRLVSEADNYTLTRLDRPDNPWLEPFHLWEIDNELRAYGDHWAQHYSGYNKRKSWTAFALRGFDAEDPGFIIKPSEMSRKWQAENPSRLFMASTSTTPAAKHFLETLAIVDRLPIQKERVRFMRLRAGDGELARHADITDREAGVQDGKVARLHIPIATNPEVRFRSWDARGIPIDEHFPAGSLFYLDTRKPHTVVNNGPTDRIHLVVDCFSDARLREWIEKGK